MIHFKVHVVTYVSQKKIKSAWRHRVPIKISYIGILTKGHLVYVYVSIPGTIHGLIGYNLHGRYNEKAGSVGRNLVKRFAKQKSGRKRISLYS